MAASLGGAAIRRFAPAALMPGGAFAVHHLRYWLAYGGRAGTELQRQGHAYLHSVVPWIVLLLALALGAFLLALGRALGGRGSVARNTRSFATLWILCATCLFAVYVSQEFLEGLFATGHPAGLAGVFAYGGWWSIPAALAVGLVLSAVFQCARCVLHAVAARRGRHVVAKARLRLAVCPQRAAQPSLGPLAAGWSNRGPPGGVRARAGSLGAVHRT